MTTNSALGKIIDKAWQTFLRFPITLIWVTLGTIFTINIIEDNHLLPERIANPIILTLVLGVSWLIATRFLQEQLSAKGKWLTIVPIALIVVFYLQLSQQTPGSISQYSYFWLYFLAGHLLAMVTPVIWRWHQNAFFNYLRAVVIALVRSLLLSGILYLGICLALLAIDSLFDINISGSIYLQAFVLCLGTINTWIYLADFPTKIAQKTTLNYPKALVLLVKYILLPLLLLYLMIVYVYGLKKMGLWDLTQVLVPYWVIALALLGFTIQILLALMPQNHSSETIRRFFPWFYIVLLPLVALLFVDILKRIGDYGFTEKRYFVLVLAGWITCMALYMLLSKKKKILILPLSLALLSLVVSFGFWGFYAVSTNSQVGQFNKVYQEIKANDSKMMTRAQERKLTSILYYLNESNATHKLASVLSYNPDVVFKNKDKWKKTHLIMSRLGTLPTRLETRSYYGYLASNFTVELAGYTSLQKITSVNNLRNLKIYGYSTTPLAVKASKKNKKYVIYLDQKSTNIKIYHGEVLIATMAGKALIDKLISLNNSNSLPANLLTIAQDNLKIIIERIHFRDNVQTEQDFINQIEGYLLIK